MHGKTWSLALPSKKVWQYMLPARGLTNSHYLSIQQIINPGPGLTVDIEDVQGSDGLQKRIVELWLKYSRL